MPKIADLPLAGALTGAEEAVIAQGGEARRAPFADIAQAAVAPQVGAAQAAAAAAEIAGQQFALTFRIDEDAISGNQILYIVDAADREVFALDLDARVGGRFNVPVALKAGTVPFTALDTTTQQRLPFTLVDDAEGVALEVVNDDGTRELVAVPFDYPRRPIRGYFDHARIADTAVSAIPLLAGTDWAVEQYADAAGVQQLRGRRRSDNTVVNLTGGPRDCSLIQLLPGDMALFARDGTAYTVPAAGGTEAPALSDGSITIASDSMGQGAVLAGLQAEYPDRPFFPVSEGGETTAGVGVSLGVKGRLTFAVTGNALPVAGQVAAVPNIGFLNDGQCARVLVTAQDGSQLGCTCYRQGANYFLKPLAYPPAPVPVVAAAPAHVTSMQAGGADAAAAQDLAGAWRGTLIMRHSTNSTGYNRDFDLPTIMGWYADMIALMRPIARQVLIVGVLPAPGNFPVALGGTSALTEAQCKTGMDNTLALNAALAATYPDLYLDPLANHAALTPGSVAQLALGGTLYSYATAAVIADGTHENVTGAANTVLMIVEAMIAKEY